MKETASLRTSARSQCTTSSLAKSLLPSRAVPSLRFADTGLAMSDQNVEEEILRVVLRRIVRFNAAGTGSWRAAQIRCGTCGSARRLWLSHAFFIHRGKPQGKTPDAKSY